MRFQLLTLIDITQTRARKGDDVFLQKQQQNYLTALQTISMRANPEIKMSPSFEDRDVKGLKFGTAYKGKHRVWKLNFNFEFDNSHSVDALNFDFNLVPIIKNLNETVNLKDAAFITGSPEFNNIVFVNLDNLD